MENDSLPERSVNKDIACMIRNAEDKTLIVIVQEP